MCTSHAGRERFPCSSRLTWKVPIRKILGRWSMAVAASGSPWILVQLQLGHPGADPSPGISEGHLRAGLAAQVSIVKIERGGSRGTGATPGTGAIPGAGSSPANLVEIARNQQSQEFVEIAPCGHRRQRTHANLPKIATDQQSLKFLQMETHGLQATPGAHGGDDHEFHKGRYEGKFLRPSSWKDITMGQLLAGS